MAVKTKEEILNSIKSLLGDNTSDEALALIEDVNDSFGNSEIDKDKYVSKEDYKALDETWRQKYRDRFFSTPIDEKHEPEISKPDSDTDEDEDKPLTFENLFTKEE